MDKICKQLLRHYCLKVKIRELNRLWDIRPTPNGTVGVQQSLTDRLHIRILKLVEVTSADAPFKVLKKVRVKLSGDGRNIGKRLHMPYYHFTQEERAGSLLGKLSARTGKHPTPFSFFVDVKITIYRVSLSLLLSDMFPSC